MVTKRLTYTDFDGNTRTEDFYFHLTEAELLKWQASEKGGLKKLIERIVQEQDQKKIVDLFEELILMAYGVKSSDGRSFIKNDKVREEFKYTQAYSDLFMELAYDADKASAFVNALVEGANIKDRSKEKE